jgi:hypothetical protein
MISNPGDIPGDAVVERDFLQNNGITSIIAFPSLSRRISSAFSLLG